MDLGETGFCVDGIQLVQNKVQRLALVNKVMNAPRFPTQESLHKLSDCRVKTLSHVVGHNSHYTS
jgi:hypothetical protein